MYIFLFCFWPADSKKYDKADDCCTDHHNYGAEIRLAGVVQFSCNGRGKRSNQQIGIDQ